MSPARTASESRDRRLHRAYLFQNGFVALVAFLFLSTSISFWSSPEELTRTLGHQPPYDYYWNGFYTAGGLMVMVGLFSRRVGIEAAGHILLVPGLVLNCTLAALVLGLHNTTIVAGVFAVAAALRAYGLVVGWQETRPV